jgi:uncharacterized membrane protein
VTDDDLRSMGLRRCLRFYTAIVVVMLWALGSQLLRVQASSLVGEASRTLSIFTLAVLGVLIAVELASGLVIAELARTAAARSRMWRFASGPVPSWLAAAAFALAALVVIGATRWAV